MSIEKQIWTDVIKEDLVPDTSFLAESDDMSSLVENDTINLAEAGVDPDVLVDNTTFPISVKTREDVPLALPLHTFDTENTVVRNVEQMESSYDKISSVVRGHKRSLQRKNGVMALQNWAPYEDGEFTPIISASGEVAKHGYKKISFEDILAMEAKFRTMGAPMDELICVLHGNHFADLQAEDKKLYKDIIAAGKIFSFKIYGSNQTAIYNALTQKKRALGAIVEQTDAISSLFYVKSEVMRAIGDITPFSKEKDPEHRGDIIGFQERFTALSIRNKYSGSIISAKA